MLDQHRAQSTAVSGVSMGAILETQRAKCVWNDYVNPRSMLKLKFGSYGGGDKKYSPISLQRRLKRRLHCKMTILYEETADGQTKLKKTAGRWAHCCISKLCTYPVCQLTRVSLYWNKRRENELISAVMAGRIPGAVLKTTLSNQFTHKLLTLVRYLRRTNQRFDEKVYPAWGCFR